MVTTRAFLVCLSRTVIARPRLYSPALRLFRSSRARHARGIKKYFPSGRYLRFRIYTQYGHENVDALTLRDDIIRYLEWVKRS